MQKQHLLYIAILLFVAGVTSCNKELPTPTDTDMALSISGGVDLEMADGDISKELIITCSTPAQEDIIVNLEAVATQNEAELSATEVTIKKGTKTVNAKITFKLAAFPEKAPTKVILVRISTRTNNVTVKGASTEFGVRGLIPLMLETKTNGTEFNTSDGDATYTITLTLTKALEENLGIQFTINSASSPIFREIFKDGINGEIPKSTTDVTLTITIPKGTEGTLIFDLKTSNEDLEVQATEFTAIFTATDTVN